MQPNQLYHYSVATLKLQPLLRNPIIYEKIIKNLRLLINAKQIKIYGYAIMPNRLELLWEFVNDAENENPQVQFLKLSSFDFLEVLRQTNKKKLDSFCIDMLFHKIQFWQKINQPTPIKYEKQALTVLKNMHYATEKFSTEHKACYSSENYYQSGSDPIKLVNHYMSYFEKQSEEIY